ncbi:Holliday junction resolvase-like protein [Thermotoga sp. SG1]|uniref:Holliday junction resolvase-like protein n=1 Tax=Thermotoga sp. SG1 TaxID=126739 RepID=UPI000C766D92|nr:Holliday junction resolvase-like protein [Thermotoga sp. SG1]PLV56767.1 Holliday junction resolvase [Thermotoga sp. SG1]
MTVLIIVILIIVVFILTRNLLKMSREIQELRGKIESNAMKMFEEWKKSEWELQRRVLEANLKREYEVKFQEWKMEEERRIREDAISKSKSVIMGQVTEHLIPFFPEFRYNPKDARFIGTPVDFVVFDGLSEGNLRRIVFVEVKTGKTGNLNTRERQVRDVVEKREVYWEKLHYRGE